MILLRFKQKWLVPLVSDWSIRQNRKILRICDSPECRNVEYNARNLKPGKIAVVWRRQQACLFSFHKRNIDGKKIDQHVQTEVLTEDGQSITVY